MLPTTRPKVSAEPPEYYVERNSWPVGGTLVVSEVLKTRKSSRVNWSGRPTEASPKIGPLINFLQRW